MRSGAFSLVLAVSCCSVLRRARHASRWHGSGRFWDILAELASAGDLPLPQLSTVPSNKRREREPNGASSTPTDNSSETATPPTASPVGEDIGARSIKTNRRVGSMGTGPSVGVDMRTPEQSRETGYVQQPREQNFILPNTSQNHAAQPLPPYHYSQQQPRQPFSPPMYSDELSRLPLHGTFPIEQPPRHYYRSNHPATPGDSTGHLSPINVAGSPGNFWGEIMTATPAALPPHALNSNMNSVTGVFDDGFYEQLAGGQPSPFAPPGGGVGDDYTPDGDGGVPQMQVPVGEQYHYTPSENASSNGNTNNLGTRSYMPQMSDLEQHQLQQAMLNNDTMMMWSSAPIGPVLVHFFFRVPSQLTFPFI